MRRFHISRHILWVVLALLWAGSLTDGNAQTRQVVRLVLQITVDGLRADLINRYEKGFSEEKGAFSSPLYIILDYGYTDTISREVRVKKIIT